MLCYYTETGRRLQKGLLLAAANFCNGNLLCEVKLLKDYSTSFAIGPFIYMYHIPHIFMTFFYQKQQLEIARYVLARQQYKIQYSLKKFFSKYYYRNTQVPNRYVFTFYSSCGFYNIQSITKLFPLWHRTEKKLQHYQQQVFYCVIIKSVL